MAERLMFREEEETEILASSEVGSTSPVVNATVVNVTLSLGGRLFAVETLFSTLVLILFNVTVIVGNSMVILAVFTHKKLRPMTTNSFIVSLAAADLMVGIAVLPFSSTNQVLKYWPFGRVCCRVWLAVDVWLCTASIFNLCAISADRYLAISRPFRYPQLMSPSRARLLIISVWILSFVICFPPLIGWNNPDQSWTRTSSAPGVDGSDAAGMGESSHGGVQVEAVVRNGTELEETTETWVLLDRGLNNVFQGINEGLYPGSMIGAFPVCTLTSEPGYIIYSACGSFWVPMTIMVIFYWKIYKTAVSATAAFRRGFIEKKDGLHNSPSDSVLTLRVHRGSRASPRHSNGCISELLPQATAVSLRLSRRSFDSSQLPVQGYTSSKLPDVLRTNFADRQPRFANHSTIPRIVITSTPSCDAGDRTTDDDVDATSSGDATKDDDVTASSAYVAVSGAHCNRSSSYLGGEEVDTIPSSEKRGSLISLKLSKLHIISQLRNLNREKKAAKTVGVIVGCFIVCWAPFFTVYLVGAFCSLCTPPMVFHVFFWLGYCNSAINPFIYGLCSREFRYAFKKLLRCRCERQRPSAATDDTSGGTGGGGGRREGGWRLMNVLRGMKLQIVTRNEVQNDNLTL